jgi:hypothetical protein
MEKEENLLSSAVIALVAERKELAQRLILHTIARNPANQQAWLYLAVTLPREKAVEALQKVLVLNPQNKLALQSLMLLRHSPDLELTLDHVMEQPTLPALFGEEPPTVPLATFNAKFEAKTQAFFVDPQFNKNHKETTVNDIFSRPVPEKTKDVAKASPPKISDEKSFSLEDVGFSFSYGEKPAVTQTVGEQVKIHQVKPKLTGGEHADSSSEPPTSLNPEENIPAYLKARNGATQASKPAYPSYSSYYANPEASVYRASHYNPVNLLENKPRVRLKERPVRRYSAPLNSGTGLTGLGIWLTLILFILIIIAVYLTYFAS